MHIKISTISNKYILRAFVACLLVFAGCKSKSGNTSIPVTDNAAETYTCPMHPEVTAHHPGSCPICGMKLVKKENASRESSQIDLSTLLQPANSVTLSSIPVISVHHATRQMDVYALGRIEYDTRSLNVISARVSGRIEKLYVKYRFQEVHAGERIMDVYSPELLTGQQNLLSILKNDPDNNGLIHAAKQRLLLLGMTDSQLQQVVLKGKALTTVPIYSSYMGHIHEAGNMNAVSRPTDMPGTTDELSLKEGMYVEKGQPVFQIYNMAKGWVAVNLFAGDNAFVKVGTPVTIIPETAPDKKFLSRISFIEPFYRAANKTVTARVYFNNAALELPVGSQVKAVLSVHTKATGWLPRQAVLSLGLNKVVMLKEGPAFRVHTIRTGMIANDQIEITDGLDGRDSVAANAQFLMDSESFIKIKQ